MRKSWLTAASVLAAAAVEGHEAQAQNFTTTPTTPSTAAFGNVRIGTTSASQALTVKNSQMLDSGSIDAATAPFSGGGIDFTSLANNGTTNTSFTFSPTSHVSSTDPVNITATKTTTTQTNTLTLTGLGVGPVYSSNPAAGSTIDFGNLAPGQTVIEDLKISNTSTDPGGALTNLGLLAGNLTGGADFKLLNFTKTTLGEGELFDLKISFESLTLGLETGDLKITTDQGATAGTNGAVFDYPLKANVQAVVAAPEPASIGLLASGLAGLAAVGLRRRRRPR
jgi:hypothetical protein